MDNIKELELRAVQTRRDILNQGPRCGCRVHVAPALSCADIVTALYFDVMKIDPANPQWRDRDRFVISKGHACPAVYSVLCRRGYFPEEYLWNAKQLHSKLQGHPDMRKTPGIDMTSGSLGNGISTGFGIALGLNYQRIDAKVFVLLGDGDSQEGIVWETLMAAPNKGCGNLKIIIDYNHLQSSGSVDKIMNMEPLADKLRAFNWNVFEMRGNDMADVVKTLYAVYNIDGPCAIIAHTTKGKGVSFIENNNAWHSKLPTAAELTAAMAELDEAERAIRER
jgi:transketolase